MKIVFAEPLGVSGDLLRKRTETLERQGHCLVFYPDRDENEKTLIERTADADILVISNIPLSRHFFESCPRLKMLSVAFTGVDHIDLPACREHGITVCNAAGYSTQAVAELTVGMMLALCRNIVTGDALTRNGGHRPDLPGCELHGKTVGIIGLGAIGQRVAQLTLAFGCRVIAFNRHPKIVPNVEPVNKETLLRQSDIISVHLPLTDGTRDFIGKAEFTQMQSHAVLINTARGPVVNGTALRTALEEGRIAAAAIDVYDREPPLPAGCELTRAPHLLMLPHIGYATQEAFASRLNIVVRNIEMWLAGTPQNQIQAD